MINPSSNLKSKIGTSKIQNLKLARSTAEYIRNPEIGDRSRYSSLEDIISIQLAKGKIPMPCVHLKSGEIVEVPLEELESYLYENADNILIRQVERRGPQRQLSKGG